MCLDELDYSNDQQVFDYVVNKLREQGESCYDEEEGICKYRFDGKKCAVGHLIKDSDYTDDFEGHIVTDAVVADYFTSKQANLELLRQLQFVHDDLFNKREEGFKKAAGLFKLKYTSPE
jgi:hypothetical protein